MNIKKELNSIKFTQYIIFVSFYNNSTTDNVDSHITYLSVRRKRRKVFSSSRLNAKKKV